MLKTTYQRKYADYQTATGAEKRKQRKLLQNIIKKATEKYLLKNGYFGEVATIEEWLTHWHNIKLDFNTNIAGTVKVTFYNCDQTWTQGYTEKPYKKVTVNKNVLFT